MKSKSFGGGELLVVAVLVMATALGGYYIYKANQIQQPAADDIQLDAAVPEASQIDSAADVSASLANVEQLNLDATLEQLDALDEDLLSS